MVSENNLILQSNVVPGEQIKGDFRIRSLKDDYVFEGAVGPNKVPNGFFRLINSKGEVEIFACFVNGVLYGNCWKSLPGGLSQNIALKSTLTKLFSRKFYGL